MPEALGNESCGAGTQVLRAKSIYEGQEGFSYNWYALEREEWVFKKGLESGTFVTEFLTNSKSYAVNVSVKGDTSGFKFVSATVLNTASILEAPAISLCDSVILHASTSLTEEELEGAKYQWQQYFAEEEGVGYYLDIPLEEAQSGLTYTVYESGFYRLIIKKSDSCRVISSECEIYGDNRLLAEIVGDDEFCFYGRERDDFLLKDTVFLSSSYGRGITQYFWEESEDSVNFSFLSYRQTVELINPANYMEEITKRYYRLTISEQNCSDTSMIFSLKWMLRPDRSELTHLESDEDFFYCYTEDSEDRMLDWTMPPRTTAFLLKLINFDTVSIGFPELELVTYYDYEDVKSMSNNIADSLISRYTFEIAANYVDTSKVLNKSDWGIYVVEAIDSLTGCASYSAPIFAETAIAIIIGLDYVCDNDVADLYSYYPEADSYDWSFSKTRFGEKTSIGNDSIITLDPSLADIEGYYTLTVEKNGCVDVSKPFYVRLEEAPDLDIETEDIFLEICQGDSVLISTITDDVSYGYAWFTDALDEVSTQSSFYAKDPGVYYVSISNKYCSVIPEGAVVISWYDQPEITLDLDTTRICGPEWLEVVNPADTLTYQWYYSEDGGFYDPVADEVLPTFLANKKGFVYCAATSEDGCVVQSDSVEIVGITDASISIYTDSAKICANGYSILRTRSIEGNAYQWFRSETDSGTFELAPGDHDSYVYLAESAGYYKVLVEGGECSRESEIIHVMPEDEDDGFSVTINGPDKLCRRNAAEFLSSYVSSSANYFWSYSTDSVTFVPFSASKSDTLLLYADVFSIIMNKDSLNLILRLEVYDSLCSVIAQDRELTIYGYPEIEINNSKFGNTDDVFFCSADELDFKLTAAQTSTSMKLRYQWQVRNASGVFEDIAGATSKEYQPVAAGSYRCVSMVNGACEFESNEINVRTLPSKIFATKQRFCSGESIEMMADPENQKLISISDFEYQWYFSADSVNFQKIANATEIAFEVTSSMQIYGSGAYFFTVKFKDCEEVSDTLFVKEEVLFPDQIITEDALCSGVNTGKVNLIYDTEIPSDFRFSIDGGVPVSDPFFDSLEIGTHTVLVSNDIGCESFVAFELRAKTEVEIDVIYEKEQRYGVPFQIEVTGAGDYEFYPESYFSFPSTGKIIVTVPEDIMLDSVTMIVTGISDDGCEGNGYFTVHLSEVETITFSSFITPDGDGYNEYFEIVGAHAGSSSVLEIYDNWGNRIYQAKDYHLDNAKAVALSNILTEGVYYFVFKHEGEVYKGSFYVKK